MVAAIYTLSDFRERIEEYLGDYEDEMDLIYAMEKCENGGFCPYNGDDLIAFMRDKPENYLIT